MNITHELKYYSEPERFHQTIKSQIDLVVQCRPGVYTIVPNLYYIPTEAIASFNSMRELKSLNVNKLILMHTQVSENR